MSFAVVKFINENEESDEEVVSEVPISWLTKNNKFCKWPPEKYCSLYITKSFPPEENWSEHAIQLECICETLAEAKEKAKGNMMVHDVGRGCRTHKPTDYFSPAEEEEKAFKKKEGKTVVKKDHFNENEQHENFMKMLNAGALIEEQDETILASIKGAESDSQKSQTLAQTHVEIIEVEQIAMDSLSSKEEGASVVNQQPSTILATHLQLQDAQSMDSFASSPIDFGSAGSSANTVVSGREIQNLEKKMDAICNFLAQLKLGIDEIKEKIDSISVSKVEEEDKFPVNFPLKSLTELDNLEAVLSNEDLRKSYARYLRDIGGHDYKDFTTRICRVLMTNSVAELCSWLGRKNNFAVGHLQFTNLAFGVVHQKTRCTRKEFELVFSEWLRHAKQRRLRENQNN